jgi:hypothetical protein
VTEKRKSFRDNLADNLGGLQPIAVPVPQASALMGKSPRGVYELMAAGELKAVKSGRNTLVLYDSIREYVAGLPMAKIKNFMCGAIDTKDEITNAWKRIKSIEEAEEIARTARAAKDLAKVAYGRRTSRKNKTRARKPCLVPSTETVSETAKSPDMESMSTAPGTETMLTIDTLGREASAARVSRRPDGRPYVKLVWSMPTLTAIPWDDEWADLYHKEALTALAA